MPQANAHGKLRIGARPRVADKARTRTDLRLNGYVVSVDWWMNPRTRLRDSNLLKISNDKQRSLVDERAKRFVSETIRMMHDGRMR